MAGFAHDVTYRCTRGRIALPHPIAFYENKFLPRLSDYRKQAKERHGDSSSCCDKFLNHILPWFVMVMVQDPVSNLLKTKIPCKERKKKHLSHTSHRSDQ